MSPSNVKDNYRDGSDRLDYPSHPPTNAGLLPGAYRNPEWTKCCSCVRPCPAPSILWARYEQAEKTFPPHDARQLTFCNENLNVLNAIERLLMGTSPFCTPSERKRGWKVVKLPRLRSPWAHWEGSALQCPTRSHRTRAHGLKLHKGRFRLDMIRKCLLSERVLMH